MDIHVLKKDPTKLVFTLRGITPALANMLRRFIINHVPTLAIDTIEIHKNSSALYDEMLAHRLGLIPLKTDLKTYKLKTDCNCKGKGCAHCELTLTLKVKGPCTVTSGDIESSDPKAKSAHDAIPIVTLLKDQELKLTATAVLGRGKDHAKFSPGLVAYRGLPELRATADSTVDQCIKECAGLVARKGTALTVTDPLAWNEAAAAICERNHISVTLSNEDFLVTIEPWGQLSAKEMLTKAITIFDTKLDTFADIVKKA